MAAKDDDLVKLAMSLDLAGTNIQSLPDNLELQFLDLSDTPIKSLPNGLKVLQLCL